MTDPGEHLRRSFVYRRLAEAGATFRAVGDAAVAASYPGETRPLGLADLSPLPRLGFKGPRALEALKAAGLAVPEANNQSCALPDGGRLLRLSDNEGLLLSDPEGRGNPLAAAAVVSGDGCYPVPRQDSHGWFLLVGEASVTCLAKLCGVDLRPRRFAANEIAQTVIAQVSAIVARDDRWGPLAFHVLADSAATPYLWDCLIDAMVEFDGGPVGIDQLSYFATA